MGRAVAQYVVGHGEILGEAIMFEFSIPGVHPPSKRRNRK
jgi:hypothetical protein